MLDTILDRLKTISNWINQGPLKWPLKLGLTILAFYLVYANLDWEQLEEVIRRANLWILLLSFLVLILSKIIAIHRISMYYEGGGINLSWAQNFNIFFIGLFYNLILPSGFGGDGYKVAYLKKNKHADDLKSALTSTLADRFNGVQGLIILVLLLIVLTGVDFGQWHWAFFGFGVCGLLGGAIVQWTFFKRFRKVQVKTYLHSILVHTLNVGSLVMNLWAVGTPDLLDYSLALALSSFAFLVPLFVGGIGSREVALIYLAGYLSISLEAALFGVFVNHVHRMMMALIGAPLVLRQKEII